jgi:two-component system sensor histidine kinase HydH
MGNDFEDKGLIFRTKIDSKTVLFGDYDLLIQILLNLLKNSLSATVAGDIIVLTIGRNGETPYLSIEDSGKGMSDDTQNKMFDPFFTESQGGTGLGLAVCHQIIEQHHGTVEVKSEIDRGTIITIHLPQKEL